MEYFIGLFLLFQTPLLVTGTATFETKSGDPVNINNPEEIVCGVARVQFFVDGNLIGEVAGGAPWAKIHIPQDPIPYKFVWDSHNVMDGPHTVQAQSHDYAGFNGLCDATNPNHSVLSNPIPFNVSNNVPAVPKNLAITSVTP